MKTTSARGFVIPALLAVLMLTLGAGCKPVDKTQDTEDPADETPTVTPDDADAPEPEAPEADEANGSQVRTPPEPAPTADAPSPAAADAPAVKVVTISKEHFSDIYPAMWFSPSTGELSPLLEESEDPPAPQYECWVEPSDPEFAFLSKGDIGFALLGAGDDAFAADLPDDVGELDRKLTNVLGNKPLSVVYVKGEGGSCVIQILKWDPDNTTIQFKWRSLD